MSILSFLSKFKHKAEIRESQDEILVGEVVHNLYRRGWPTVDFSSGGDLQLIRFRTLNDPVLYSLRVRLDRKTGTGAVGQALLGSKATLRITGEVKNLLADPDELLNQWSTDLQNVMKMPLFGDIKLNHELNSIYAEKAVIIEIQDYVLKGDEGRVALDKVLDESIDELKNALAKYKRDT